MAARTLYRILLWLLVPALVIRLLWRARKQPEYLRNLGERFGAYGRDARPDGDRRPLLWLHAVSVGEVRAAEPLVRSLTASHPDADWLITCMTPTGRETAQALYGAMARPARVVYLPYDFAFAQRRFLRHFRPRLGVLMETELWPNLLFEARAAGVPLALVNARLSARSARGYLRFAALTRPALACLTRVAAQTAADGLRLADAGAPAPIVCGNLKFEVSPKAEMLAQGAQWRAAIGRFVWLAASTRDGEEALILDAYKLLAAAGKAPLLTIVPRHPQRFAEVAAMIERRGFRMRRRSQGLPGADTEVWLGDTMGEMVAYYAAANLCVIGGSLQPFGSQNLIEACACACPVLVGPSDFNFRQAAADALARGAAIRVAADARSLAQAVAERMEDRAALTAQRDAALAFAAEHRGAAQKTQAVLDGLWRMSEKGAATTSPTAR